MVTELAPWRQTSSSTALDALCVALWSTAPPDDVRLNPCFCFLPAQQASITSSQTRSVSHARRSGLGVCAFLEAALGMESARMGEAARLIRPGEARARKAAKKSKIGGGAGVEILNADADVLLGLTHALPESYMDYFQCMYALNAALSMFTKLFHAVFSHGLEYPSVSATGASPSRTLRTSTSVSGLSVTGLSISDSSGSSSPRICEREREHSDARRPRLCPRSIALDIEVLGRLGLVLLREPGAPPRAGGTGA
ncbi:hypothetical protein C8R44DRAFT_888760 [Mycena epipterygia]|nr:hypothetical protein C8R44DRAFT_888760 [Mycena epipterygia]